MRQLSDAPELASVAGKVPPSFRRGSSPRGKLEASPECVRVTMGSESEELVELRANLQEYQEQLHQVSPHLIAACCSVPRTLSRSSELH